MKGIKFSKTKFVPSITTNIIRKDGNYERLC